MRRFPAVVVTTGKECATELIGSLLRWYADQLDVILVCNGCPEERIRQFRSQLRGQDRIRILPENRGGSGGFRVGMLEAEKNYAPDSLLWLLDDDAVINEQTLPKLLNGIRELERRKIRWGAAGSLIRSLEQPDRITEAGAAVDFFRGGFRAALRGERAEGKKMETYRECEYCPAASLLTRIARIGEIGPFADVFLHFDDVEWCWRLRKHGYRIFCVTDSFILHPTNCSKPATWVRYYDAANLIWFCRKSHPFFLPWIVFLQLCRSGYFALHGMGKTARLYRLGIRDGLRGEQRRLPPELETETFEEVPGDFWSGDKVALSITGKHAEQGRIKLGGARVISLDGPLWKRCVTGFRVQILSLFSPGRSFVMDDAFRNKLILPVWGRKRVYYNAELDKLVRK